MKFLEKKIACIVGIRDYRSYGWAIAKAIIEAGGEIIFCVWVPCFSLFKNTWKSGKWDSFRELSNGQLFSYQEIYPIDLLYDTAQDIPCAIKNHRRYRNFSAYSIADVAYALHRDYGKIDYLIHAAAYSPNPNRSLLDTSRKDYLCTMSASSYSFVSLVANFGPILKENQGAVVNLTFLASRGAYPGYGGGLSSAKAALESDTKTLSLEAGKKWGIRINSLSAPPFPSAAATSLHCFQKIEQHWKNTTPLHQEFHPSAVGSAAVFLLSPHASAITGEILHVDHGMHIMSPHPYHA